MLNRDILNPSLLAEIRCPTSMDCKIRLNVYYSSSLTGGKEVILASTTFSKREFFNAVGIDIDSQGSETSCAQSTPSSPGRDSDRENPDRVFVSPLNSEFCPGAKAYIEILEPLPQPFTDPCFRITAMPRQSPPNPLVQRYVFYSDSDPLSPLIDTEEAAWEPRFMAIVPMLFLQSFSASLLRSIHSWNVRTELERMRQGRFSSLAEASSFGWQQITVTVVAARIGNSKVRRERQLHAASTNTSSISDPSNSSLSGSTSISSSSNSNSNSNSSHPNLSHINPQLKSQTSVGGNRSSVARQSMLPSSSANAGANLLPFRVYVPVELENEINYSSQASEVPAPPAATLPESESLPPHPVPPPPPSQPTASDSLSLPTSSPSTATSVRFRVDDTAPSSFVSISVGDRCLSFIIDC